MSDRSNYVLAHGLIPIDGAPPVAPRALSEIQSELAEVMARYGHGAHGTTRSAIVHAPVAPSRPVVHGVQQPTADDLKIAAMLGVTPEAFAEQRRAEQTGAGGASRWRSGAVGGDE